MRNAKQISLREMGVTGAKFDLFCQNLLLSNPCFCIFGYNSFVFYLYNNYQKDIFLSSLGKPKNLFNKKVLCLSNVCQISLGIFQKYFLLSDATKRPAEVV